MIFAASWIICAILTSYRVLRMHFYIALSYLAAPLVAYILHHFLASPLLADVALGSLMGVLTPMLILAGFNFYWQSNMYEKKLKKKVGF